MEINNYLRFGLRATEEISGNAYSLKKRPSDYTSREPYGFSEKRGQILMYDSNRDVTIVIENPAAIPLTEGYVQHIIESYES